jgi:8-amino-7-oxononanoate synthase
VPDFTSALYLGLRHPSRALRPWEALTRGAPAALLPVPGAARVARRWAALQGAEACVLVPSTLHAAWDLSTLVDGRRDAVLLDAEAYPILAVAAGLARGRRVPVRHFAHFDAQALRRAAVACGDRRPVVIVDGLCPTCGRPAPLRALVDAVRRFGGLVVVDDTQAIGLVGAGGGGSLRLHGLERAADVLLVASAAKAFGVPAAAVSGSRGLLARYTARSRALVHCSPVSVATVRAFEHALAVNAARGDALRARLARLIARFRAGLRRLGVTPYGGSFPVQSLPVMPAGDALQLHERLLASGVRAVPQTQGDRGRVIFLLTAGHDEAEVDEAVTALARLCRRERVAA